MDFPITRLNTALQAAGIPYEHCAIVTRGTPPTVRIDFKSEATAEQRAQAQAIVADTSASAWWRPRQKRSYASLMTQIANLSAADRTKLVNLMLEDWLREHPKMAAQFGVNLDGEEVA